MREREISLADLVIEILLHWRGIILLMVIGGVLLGAFSYMRSSQNAKVQQAEVEAMKNQADVNEAVKQSLADTLTQEQMNYVNYVLYLEDASRATSDYAEDSVLMQIDSSHVQKVDVIFLVTSDDLEKTYNIEKVYEDLADGAELRGELAKVSGLSASAVDEIYLLGNEIKNSGKSDVDAFRASKLNGSDTFRISFLHYDQEMCQSLAQTVIDYLEGKHSLLEGRMGRHEITVLSQSAGTIGDVEIFERQKSVLKDMYDWPVFAQTYKDRFSAEAQQYYDLLVRERDAADGEVVDMSDSIVVAAPGVSLKYVIIGMFLGAVAYAFVIFLRYVLNNRIRSTDNLQALYDIPQLGQIPNEGNGRKLFGFLDKWFLALRYWGRRKFTEEEAMNLAVVAVKMAARKNGLAEICFIGCDLKGRALETYQQMEDMLSKEQIETQILDNVLYNVESLEKLGNAKGVVLLEKADSALYTEIAKELEVLKRQDIRILGGIIVNA